MPMVRPLDRRPLKAAIACREAAGVTGTTTTILEHCRRLASLGWEVHVFAEKADAGRVARAGGQTHVLPRWPLGSALKRRLFAWRFERELKGESFDLLWGHGDTLRQDVLSLHNCVHAASEAVCGRPLPRGSGVGRIHARMLKERRFRLLIANSELMKRDVTERWGVPPELVRVVHPGHDPERFKAGDRERLGLPLRRELGVPSDGLLVGLITSGDFAKRGVEGFLEALGRLPAELKPRLHAVVMGKEARLKPYERALAAAGLGERARLLPSDPRVERWYHALDLYVHPARFEEFGQSVQEAMACGVPVLTTERVGAAELLPPPAREWLLPEPRPEALAGAMARLLEDADLRRRLGEWGREACRANTWDENFRRTMEALARGGLLPKSNLTCLD